MSRTSILTMCIAGTVWMAADATVATPAENDEVRQLSKARLEVAHKGFESAGTVQRMWIWAERVLQCELALCDGADNRIAAFESHLRRAEKIEKMVVEGHKAGAYTAGELLEAKFHRLDTQCKLAEEKTKKSFASK